MRTVSKIVEELYFIRDLVSDDSKEMTDTLRDILSSLDCVISDLKDRDEE